MSETPHELEARLCRVYEQQAEKYESVLRLSDGLEGQLDDRDGSHEQLCRITSLLDEISQMDQQARESRDRWLALQRRPSGRLKQILARLEGLVSETLDQIAKAEACARQAHQRLLPELGREANGERMRRAYGAASRG
jgi:hypothetical protein